MINFRPRRAPEAKLMESTAAPADHLRSHKTAGGSDVMKSRAGRMINFRPRRAPEVKLMDSIAVPADHLRSHKTAGGNDVMKTRAGRIIKGARV